MDGIIKGISYYGGKSRISRHIVEAMPLHHTYIEPFCGGLHVFGRKGRPSTRYIEVLNDLDEKIVNMYRHIRDSPELLEQLRYTPYSRVELERAGKILAEQSDGVDAACAQVVALKMTRGYPWGVSSLNRPSGNHDSAASYVRLVESLQIMADRLKAVTIESMDASDIMRRYDEPGALFYLDPPYPGTGQQKYRHKYDIEAYKTLCAQIESAEGSVVLSCYEQGCEPAHWVRHRVKTRRIISGQPEPRMETIFVVDRSESYVPKVRMWLKHLWSPSRGVCEVGS